MMGDVLDFAAARERRGLRPSSRVAQPRRPTLRQARGQYGVDQFDTAAMVNIGRVAHRVDVQTPIGDRLHGLSRCGQGGLLSQPDPDVLVCLRCWPWWHA